LERLNHVAIAVPILSARPSAPNTAEHLAADVGPPPGNEPDHGRHGSFSSLLPNTKNRVASTPLELTTAQSTGHFWQKKPSERDSIHHYLLPRGRTTLPSVARDKLVASRAARGAWNWCIGERRSGPKNCGKPVFCVPPGPRPADAGRRLGSKY